MTVLSSDSTTVTLNIGTCNENGGSILLKYTLYRDDGSMSLNYSKVYSG